MQAAAEMAGEGSTLGEIQAEAQCSGMSLLIIVKDVTLGGHLAPNRSCSQACLPRSSLDENILKYSEWTSMALYDKDLESSERPQQMEMPRTCLHFHSLVWISFSVRSLVEGELYRV